MTAKSHHRNKARVGLVLVLGLLLGLAFPTSSPAAEKQRFKPVKKTSKKLVFNVAALDARQVRRAKVRLSKRRSGAWASASGARSARRSVKRRRVTGKVRRAARHDTRLRLRRGKRIVRRGELTVVVKAPQAPETNPQPPSAAPSGPATGGGEACAFVGISECTVLDHDRGGGDPDAQWGKTDCMHSSRAQSTGGYRHLTVMDGDDIWGERCELGRNEHRRGADGGDGTFHLYSEGERKITQLSVRLPDNYPLQSNLWQVIAQMKQTQPSANGGGTPVIALHARGGEWSLDQSKSTGPSSDTRQLFSAPAQRNAWTKIALDVTYSQDPSKGKVQMFIDLNGDGDAADAGERSDVIHTYTLKRETAGGSASDGIAEGESIPSHLRIGPYHNEAIDCPPPGGCSVDYDDIQVLQPN